MSLTTALLLSLLAGFAYFSRRFMGDLFLERPIILAPLTGLIMGDLQTGLLVGGTLELVFMGAADIGGSVPPNYTIGSIIGAAFAIASGQSIGNALLVAIPAALLGSFFELLAKTASVFFVNAAERYANNGNSRGICWMLHLGNAAHFLADAVPTFFALWLGIEAVTNLTESIPQWLESGINVAGAILPALGFALLLNSLVSRRMFPWFFLGFVMAAYTQFDVLGVALLAVLVVLAMQSQQRAVAGPDVAEAAPAGEGASGAGLNRLSRRDVRQLFWRSFAIQSAFSFDRMQAMGFTWSLIPFLRKIYAGKPKELAAALRRHLSFFNTHPWVPGPILALTADLEAKKAEGADIPEETIQGVKAGLMGPLAGIGDAMFHGTLRPLMGGVAASLALQDNALAPILFFAVVNAVHLLIRWYTLDAGHRLGEQAMTLLATSGRRLLDGAAVVGLMAVGALSATWLKVTTPLVYRVQDAEIAIQSMLDGIMPGLLPLATVLLVFGLVRRGASTTRVMVGMMIAGLVLGGLGILG